MGSPQFRCPHCQALLTKSDADQVLGEVGDFVAFGSSVETCPACGGSIDRQSIIAGKYDEKASIGGCLGIVIVAIIIGIIIWLFG